MTEKITNEESKELEKEEKEKEKKENPDENAEKESNEPINANDAKDSNTENASAINNDSDLPKKEKKRKKKEPTPLKPFKELSFWERVARIFYYAIPVLLTFAVAYINFRAGQEFLNADYQVKNHRLEFLNCTFWFILIWIIAFISNRIRVGILSSTLLAFIFGIIDHYVISFRSTPILPWDIMSVGTAVDVAGNYEYKLNDQSLKAVVIFLSLIAVEVALFFIYRRRTIIKKKIIKIIAIIISIAMMLIYGTVQQSIQVMEWADYFSSQYYPLQFVRKNGIASSMVFDMQYLKMKKLEGYTVDNAKKILKEHDTSNILSTDEQNDKKYPNVIAIMNETWADLDVLGLDISADEGDIMPFTKSLMAQDKNTISGHCHVSVCGGNTANSEFEYITGNSMKFFADGTIPFTSYIKNGAPSMISHMQRLGYDTYYLHPNYPRSWNRNNVYKRFGMDNIFFDDLDGDDKKVTGIEKFRTFTSDKFTFNRIEQIFDQKKNDSNKQPFFMWTVTIQNHGGYSHKYANFTPWLHDSKYDSNALDTYLSLINLTDQDFEQLIDYFKDYDEPTIILMFGDHQPGTYILTRPYAYVGKNVLELDEDDMKLRYQTPYVMWANFDIKGAKNVDSSPNFLGAQELQAAGVPTSDYQNFLLDLNSKFDFISTVNTQTKKGVSKDEEKKLLKEYEKVQYYRMNDFKK